MTIMRRTRSTILQSTALCLLILLFTDAAVSQLTVYSLGDGEAMSGLLIAAQRDESTAVFLVFLLD